MSPGRRLSRPEHRSSTAVARVLDEAFSSEDYLPWTCAASRSGAWGVVPRPWSPFPWVCIRLRISEITPRHWYILICNGGVMGWFMREGIYTVSHLSISIALIHILCKTNLNLCHSSPILNFSLPKLSMHLCVSLGCPPLEVGVYYFRQKIACIVTYIVHFPAIIFNQGLEFTQSDNNDTRI